MRVVAACIERCGRVLLVQRPAGKARAGLWELPGGKVEAGEDDAAALLRELTEELEVKARIGQKLYEVTHAYTDLSLQLAIYAATFDETVEPQPIEAACLGWFSPAEWGALEVCAADAQFLAALALGS